MKTIKLFAVTALCLLSIGCATTHNCPLGKENTKDCGKGLQFAFDHALLGTTAIPDEVDDNDEAKQPRSAINPHVSTQTYAVDVSKELPQAIRQPERLFRLKIYPRIQNESGRELFYSSTILYYSIDGKWAGAPVANSYGSVGSSQGIGLGYGDTEPKLPVEDKQEEVDANVEAIPSLDTIRKGSAYRRQ